MTTLDATINSPTLNSYIDVAGADTYFSDRMHSEAWLAATAEQKRMALLWAAKILDTRVRWKGTRFTQAQPMAWPRAYVQDPDFSAIDPARTLSQTYAYLPTDAFPNFLKWAQCEQALALLGSDTSLDPETFGYNSLSVGPISVSLDNTAVARVLPRPVRDLVAPYGQAKDGGGGTVKLLRT